MSLWSLAQVAELLGARLVRPSGTDAGAIRPAGLCLDTRELIPGEAFVALCAQRDGHDFARSAAERGACALLVDHALDLDLPQLVVPDTLAALQAWGRARLAAFRPAFVAGVTGSVGKTTTKELLAAATDAWKTPGNRNNTLGLPQALATLPEGTGAAVLEMGMSTPGEIACLTGIAPPDAGVVTVIGTAHLENFPEGLQGIARAKGELVRGLRPGGFWCHPAGDPWCAWIARTQPQVRVVPVGVGGAYAWARVRSRGVRGQAFDLLTPGGTLELELALGGAHHVSNASLAAACALEAGFAPEAVRAGLASVQPEPGRGRLHELEGGGVLLDESYNASPDSVLACARALLELEGGEAVAVLGCMREMGPGSAAIHQTVGAGLREAGLERLLAFGDFARELAEGFGGGKAFPDFEALRDDPAGLATLPAGARILVKGSRYWRAERAVAWLLERLRPRSPLQEG